MKKFKYLFLCFVLFTTGKSFSQALPQDAVDIVNDLLVIADGFATPAAESAAYQATASWFTSARALEPWKVDVSLHANALFVPSSKKEFNVSNNDFSNLSISGGDRGAVIPTAFGSDSDVMFNGSLLGSEFSFEAIDGIDKGALFYPFAQVSVGLPYGFQLGVRALPELEVDGSNFSTYGVGLKYNISQNFRFNKKDDLQVAAILAYDIFDVKYEFEQISVPNLVNLDLIDVSAGVWMAEVMASKRYEDFEIFGALGVAQSDFEYEFGGSGAALSFVNTNIATLNDTQAQFKGDIGFNLYFNHFKISTMATAGKYLNLNVGLHFLL